MIWSEIWLTDFYIMASYYVKDAYLCNIVSLIEKYHLSLQLSVAS